MLADHFQFTHFSVDANKSALSVLSNSDGTRKVKHYRITKDTAKNELKISSSKSFLSLDQLLRYYKEEVNGHRRLLSHPLPKPPPPALQAREFSINRSQVELGSRIDRGSFGRTYMATYRSCEVIAKRASSSICRQTLLEVAEAMDYLENARSFHGDLRAANVFFTADFTVKVGNFGLNKILNDNETNKQSRMYTLRWAAPETVKTGYVCSIKADVWSFGVLAFEVFTFASEPYAENLFFMLRERFMRDNSIGDVIKAPSKASR
ncbi:unnamed protein product [Dibothriocephalus latus]|uniref:Non-specific protein-tyrosine kinase n=1 Tax=Dibothriocephalus latus TaxID=60516 RepID=A0A3P7LI71_DIBLA|nr:unnamed protein product [Dibothriocephalus latus]